MITDRRGDFLELANERTSSVNRATRPAVELCALLAMYSRHPMAQLLFMHRATEWSDAVTIQQEREPAGSVFPLEV